MKEQQKNGLLYAIFFLSGAAGLGYQMAWTRMFAVGLGHEMPSVLAVVAAFFAGLALGSWLLDGPISRSGKPGHWYVALELIIGTWGFLSLMLIPIANVLAGQWIGVAPSPIWQWLVSFGLPLVVLLPATTAMGATLPAMERFLAPRTAHGRVVGGLYAANTAGAVAGTLLSAFVIIPAWGYSASLMTLAVVNLVCVVAIWPLLRGTGTMLTTSTPTAAEGTTRHSNAQQEVLLVLFFTGLLGIGYEIVGLRAISQVLENTVYSYAAVLSVYLIGTALGAWLYQRFWLPVDFDKLLAYLLSGLATTCMLGGLALSGTEELYTLFRSRLDYSIAAVMVSEMAVAAAVFLLPTILMGATFSHLVQAARRAEGGVGRAMAVNTLGGFVAPLLVGVVLMPAIGVKWTLVAVALGYLPLTPHFNQAPWVGMAAPVLLMLVMPGNLRLVKTEGNERVIDYREGVTAAVAVVATPTGSKNLRVNNHFTMGSTATRGWELRQGHLPLLLHPAPRRALFLGLGTGITFQATRYHPGLVADGVELVPEVVEVLSQFESPDAAMRNDARTTVYTADARRFVRATRDRYDVIVADLFHPGRDGGGMLYTREHFQTVRDRLNTGGLFCQWLPLYQLDEPVLRVIIKTFLEVFPDGRALLMNFQVRFPALAMIGTAEPEPARYAPDWYQSRVPDGELRMHLESVGLSNGYELFGLFVAGSEQLHRYVADTPVNTDNHPIVVFQAPHFTYLMRVTGYGRLLAMLKKVRVAPGELIAESPHTHEFTQRLAKYIEARDIYLRAAASQTDSVERTIESAAASMDFVNAYNGVLAIAKQRIRSDPGSARSLLERLIEARPERSEARQLLDGIPSH